MLLKTFQDFSWHRNDRPTISPLKPNESDSGLSYKEGVKLWWKYLSNYYLQLLKAVIVFMNTF